MAIGKTYFDSNFEGPQIYFASSIHFVCCIGVPQVIKTPPKNAPNFDT